MTQLRLLVKDSNYAKSEEMVQDCMVLGINLPKVVEKLFNAGSNLALDKALGIARNYDMAQAQLKSFASSSNSNTSQGDQAFHTFSRQFSTDTV